jgi:hypothetical protein
MFRGMVETGKAGLGIPEGRRRGLPKGQLVEAEIHVYRRCDPDGLTVEQCWLVFPLENGDTCRRRQKLVAFKDTSFRHVAFRIDPCFESHKALYSFFPRSLGVPGWSLFYQIFLRNSGGDAKHLGLVWVRRWRSSGDKGDYNLKCSCRAYLVFFTKCRSECGLAEFFRSRQDSGISNHPIEVEGQFDDDLAQDPGFDGCRRIPNRIKANYKTDIACRFVWLLHCLRDFCLSGQGKRHQRCPAC